MIKKEGDDIRLVGIMQVFKPLDAKRVPNCKREKKNMNSEKSASQSSPFICEVV